jgi:PAS domain S-box-containing protein
MQHNETYRWQRDWKALLRNLALAAILVMAGLLLQHSFQHEAGKRQSRRYSRELATILKDHIVATPAIGAVKSLGISNERLKAVVKNMRPEDDPSLLDSLHNMKNCAGASIIYAMDRDGHVLISTTYDDGKTLTGKNYAFRPYFKKAINGEPATYPALGATTFERGIYYAAPIYDSTAPCGNPGAIIGVVVMKMPFKEIDEVFSESAGLVSLVSPQGVVLSSSNPEWLLNSIPELNNETNTAKTANNPEYQTDYFKSHTKPFPLALDSTTKQWQNANYFIQTFPLDLNDPAGHWTLLVMEDTAAWFPVEQLLLTAGLILGFSLAVAVAIYARKLKRIAIVARLRANAEAAQTYKSIFNATTDALFVHDSETHKILDANQSAKKLYGYSDTDIASLSPEGDYPYPPDAAEPALKAAMKNRKQMITFQSRGNKGKPFWAQATFNSYTIHGNVRILVCVHDITEQRASHSALTASKELLEKEVRTRTVQLLQAQKMAAIGKFAERITHDVTNAMTRIIGHADMIRHRPDDRVVRENALNEIDMAAREMCSFSTDLLAFSHPAPLKLESMNLVRTVDAFQGFIQSSAPPNIDVHVDLPKERLMASISPNHIEQALAQLSINSFESMPKGGRLDIKLRRGEPDDRPITSSSVVKTNPERLAVIEVSDTGSGIAPENLPHIFDPFFTTKKDQKRRGLGLTTVYLIASSHNGWVNVIPHTDRPGNTVQLWLPLLKTP